MLNIYISGEDGVLQEINEFAKGAWVHLTAPDEEEIQKVVQSLGIPADFIRDPLDEEERSRIDKEGDNLLIIVDIPILENEGSRDEQYITIPLGMIVTPDLFITV